MRKGQPSSGWWFSDKSRATLRPMPDDSILAHQEAAVLTLTLNRPAAFNSFTQPMAAALQDHLRAADADASVRCVVLTGAGKAFCAGQDLKEITGENAPTFEEIVGGSYNATVRLIRGLNKPVIAAVNGVAAGAGANLALACDLCVAAEGAKFIQAFSKIGLIPDSGGTWMLPPVGRHAARDSARLSRHTCGGCRSCRHGHDPSGDACRWFSQRGNDLGHPVGGHAHQRIGLDQTGL